MTATNKAKGKTKNKKKVTPTVKETKGSTLGELTEEMRAEMHKTSRELADIMIKDAFAIAKENQPSRMSFEDLFGEMSRSDKEERGGQFNGRLNRKSEQEENACVECDGCCDHLKPESEQEEIDCLDYDSCEECPKNGFCSEQDDDESDSCDECQNDCACSCNNQSIEDENADIDQLIEALLQKALEKKGKVECDNCPCSMCDDDDEFDDDDDDEQTVLNATGMVVSIIDEKYLRFNEDEDAFEINRRFSGKKIKTVHHFPVSCELKATSTFEQRESQYGLSYYEEIPESIDVASLDSDILIVTVGYAHVCELAGIDCSNMFVPMDAVYNLETEEIIGFRGLVKVAK